MSIDENIYVDLNEEIKCDIEINKEYLKWPFEEVVAYITHENTSYDRIPRIEKLMSYIVIYKVCYDLGEEIPNFILKEVEKIINDDLVEKYINEITIEDYELVVKDLEEIKRNM